MNNKIELLRAVWFTTKDSPNTTGVDFTDDEKKLVEKFKKMYEMGKVPHLQTLIEELNKQGSENIDPHTLEYMKSILRNGPFGEDADKLIAEVKDKKGDNNIKDMSDNVGINADLYFTTQNTYLFRGEQIQGCNFIQHNKLPKFMTDTLKKAVEVTQNLFTDNVVAIVITDNTLPLLDKLNQRRYDKETNQGSIVIDSIGNYCVKDRYFYKEQNGAVSKVKEKISKYLKQSRFDRLYMMKGYNPFDGSFNKSVAPTPKSMTITEKIKKFNPDGSEGEEKEFKLNLMLDEVFDKESVESVPSTNEKVLKDEDRYS